MSTPYIGEIIMFAGNFAISGWAFCNGQLTSIAQESTLFALIGTTYGGDGVNTFALPNLQSRVAINQGTGPGLSTYVLGQAAGNEAVTLSANQLPAHIHQPVVNLVDGTVDAPATTAMPAKPKQVANSATLYTDPTKTPVVGDLKAMQVNLLLPAGNSQPHNNVMPVLAVNFLISLQGIFPSQN